LSLEVRRTAGLHRRIDRQLRTRGIATNICRTPDGTRCGATYPVPRRKSGPRNSASTPCGSREPPAVRPIPAFPKRPPRRAFNRRSMPKQANQTPADQRLGAASPGPLHRPKKNRPAFRLSGFGYKALAMTYSYMREAHYHRRGCVSLPSSGWDRVVPQRYGRQGEGGGSRLIKDCGCSLMRGIRMAIALTLSLGGT
jgi:hypothetical protein